MDAGPIMHVPGYAVGGIGARYKFPVYGKDMTVALNIDNVTNNRYWLSPYYAGAPLTVRFSAAMRF